jgi:phosphate/sulfate permease
VEAGVIIGVKEAINFAVGAGLLAGELANVVVWWDRVQRIVAAGRVVAVLGFACEGCGLRVLCWWFGCRRPWWQRVEYFLGVV